MADTKYPPSTDATPSGELDIKMYPRHHDQWIGTAAALTDAGLIPDGFEWPVRTRYKTFEHMGMRCSLQRKAIPGSKTRVDVDNWKLMRFCANNGTNDSTLYEKQQAVARLLWWRSAAGQHMFRKLMVSQQDIAFQNFKRNALGLKDR